MSGKDDLFGGLPEGEKAAAKPGGAARLREPVRDQVGLRVVDLDALSGRAIRRGPSGLTFRRLICGSWKKRSERASIRPAKRRSARVC